MRIPFANRTADVDLPVAPGQPKVTVKIVIDAFREQLPSNFAELFEAFVLLSPRKVRVTCRTPRRLEELLHLGLTFRNTPVTFHPCKIVKWVNITRLSYGVPPEAITEALRPYGKVLQIKIDVYQGVYIGVRNVLMEIANPIPSTLNIAAHWCNVFYPGQTPTCFACKKAGHTRANCPGDVPPPVPAVDAVAGAEPVLLSPAHDDLVHELVGSVGPKIPDTDGGRDAATDPKITASDQPSDPDPVITSTSDSFTSDSSSDDGPQVAGIEEDARHSGDDGDDSMDMDAHQESRKRVLSAGDSSDSSSDESFSRHRKKGKAIQAALSHLGDSPDLFDPVSRAASTPLPDDFDPELDLNMDTPTDPDHVDEPIRSTMATDSHDYPLTQKTPIVKTRIPAPTASQSSSSGFDMFISRKTRPRPVVGTGHIAPKQSPAGSGAEFALLFLFSMANSVEFITLNCQGLRSADHRATLFSWLNCCSVDFLCLQETHSLSEREFHRWLQEAMDSGILRSRYQCVSSPGTNRSCGVAIIYRSDYSSSDCVCDTQGRFVAAQFSRDNTTFTLCNVYGPNKAREGGYLF